MDRRAHAARFRPARRRVLQYVVKRRRMMPRLQIHNNCDHADDRRCQQRQLQRLRGWVFILPSRRRAIRIVALVKIRHGKFNPFLPPHLRLGFQPC